MPFESGGNCSNLWQINKAILKAKKIGMNPSRHQFRRALRRILSLPAEGRLRMGQAAREKMIREFDEKIVIARYLRAIRDIVPTDK